MLLPSHHIQSELNLFFFRLFLAHLVRSSLNLSEMTFKKCIPSGRGSCFGEFQVENDTKNKVELRKEDVG